MKTLLKVTAGALAYPSFFLSLFLLLHAAPPAAAALTLPKMLAAALAAYVAVAGLAGGALGLALGYASLMNRRRNWQAWRGLGWGLWSTMLTGLAAALLSAGSVFRVAAPQPAFDAAFGENWQQQIPSELSSQMLAPRWSWSLPESPEPRVVSDVAAVTLPDGQVLTADIWRPPEGVGTTGVAYLYINMGGWRANSRDACETLFRHLTGQGHVVVSFVSRQRGETDVVGMVGDIKRAILWLKEAGTSYGVDPGKIVIAGGSAGGHLALLTAYSAGAPGLTPADLAGEDTSVRAAVGYYAPNDLLTYYEIEGRRPSSWFDQLGEFVYLRAASDEGLGVADTTDLIMRELLGGLPDEAPDMYRLATVSNYVGPNTPPTLLFHGRHDSAAPIASTRALVARLTEAGVPAALIEMPATEHAFDYVLPELSPPAQASFYYLDRFLALIAVSSAK
jgi:acetyl esterase/lipase